MKDLAWWTKASIWAKKQTIRFLNEDSGARWPFPMPPVRVVDKRRKRVGERVAIGLPVAEHLVKEIRSDQKLLRDHYSRVGIVLEWKHAHHLPPDIRRCERVRCAKFFLLEKTRLKRIFCSPKCGSNCRALRSMNKKKQEMREEKLVRLRIAVEKFRDRADWKDLAARQAGLTTNFVTYAVRRGEIETVVAC